MSRPPEQYEDDRELTEYIWHNFGTWMTDLERRAARALLAEVKASQSAGPVTSLFQKRWGRDADPQVAALLDQGAEAFRKRVRERILSEMGDAIVVNRCPACGLIVATPKAKQCLWCGHDWHNI